MAKKSKFYEEINGATLERQVEDVYMKGLKTYFKGEVTFPYGCDGYLEEGKKNTLRLLSEFKLDYNLNSSMERAKVLIQVIFYLKRFENEGKILPNVILVGDKNECFLLHTNDILKYLDYDLDWSIAPSTAHNKYIETCIELSKEENLRSLYIHEVNDKFSFKDIADKIKDMNKNIKRQIRITEHNLDIAFETFIKKTQIDIDTISPNNLVGIFVGCLTNKPKFYIHPDPEVTNTLVTPYGWIKVKTDGFKSYVNHFSRDYTAIEIRKFTEIADRLIEDVNRRRKGEFYTPKLFVDYAHKMIEEQLGADWREKFVVWDNCCGTKNLTKDYNFKELYCSTLEKSELEMSAKYNPNSTSFQFDFLNDSLDNLPQGLRNAFAEDKPIVFFINPPYATSATFSGEKQKEDGLCDTIVSEEMRSKNLGLACRNLITQFLYRIIKIKNDYNLTNCHIAIFTNPNFECANSFDKFRKEFFKHFKYNNGIYFNAGHFSDVSSKWGIAFEIWNNGIQIEKNDFPHLVVEVENNTITPQFTKIIYNCDNLTNTSDWIRETKISTNKVDMPIMKSAINFFENPRNKSIGQLTDDSIGCYYHIASDVYNSATYVALFTSNCSHPSGKWSITKNNFNKVMPTFSARKLINGNWYDDKDVFLKPNTDHEKWNQFVADSVVYSLFHSASNQSSLRQIEYKGSKWDIKNEFFFISKERMAELANECGNSYLYSDCITSNDRFVYEWLTEHKDELSDTAKEVLAKAIELTEKSMAYRELFNNDHEEYQINNWDCGWYQIKAMLKEYMPNEYKEFNELYKKLADEMRPMVYELGFLK